MKIDDIIKKYQRPISIIGAIVIVFSVYAVFQVEADNADYWEPGDDGGGGGGGGGLEPGERVNVTRDPVEGYLDEGDSNLITEDPGGLMIRVFATLDWDESDETSYPFPYENTGDTFTLRITGPGGMVAEDTDTNPQGGAGHCEIDYAWAEGDMDLGALNITVIMEDAGDHWPFGQPSVGFTDSGNSYTLYYEFDYYVALIE